MRHFFAAIMMLLSPFVLAAADSAVVDTGLVQTEAEVDIRTIPFALRSTVKESIEKFASQCDLLTLGEVHGTQEVPLIARELLTPLSERGYRVLALEVGKDEQAALVAWATGKSNVIPDYFFRPIADGKGNLQTLSLIRCALSEPYKWNLVCFDTSLTESLEEFAEWKRKNGNLKGGELLKAYAVGDHALMFWKKRDEAMASNLKNELSQIVPRPKVLAICGGMHNRISNRALFPEMEQYWPCFAAVAQRDNPDWKVGSINIQFHGGGFFNNGKVNKFGGQKIDQMEIHPAIETGYHFELNLPQGTPATFLATPTNFDL